MIGKIIVFVFLISFLVVASYFLYQNLPGPEEQFKIANPSETDNQAIDYGTTKQFYPNMRFNHNEISYYLDPSCIKKRMDRMENAFSIINEKTKIISFYQTTESKADILVSCSETSVPTQEDFFIAGEGGPSKIVNTTLYNVILEGKILLYRETECPEDFPVVELHELLHVFGFDHSENKKSIMNNLSSCDQEITPDILTTLDLLYKQQPLPDLYIDKIDATKSGRYLDFQIEVRNRGLLDVSNASVSLFANNEEVESFPIDEVEFGAGKILKATNVKLPSRNTDKVEFIVDPENMIQELSKANNKIELSLD